MLLALTTLLLACGQTKEETQSEPPPRKPIEAPPEESRLGVSGGQIGIVALQDGETDVPANFPAIEGSFHFDDRVKLAGLSGEILVSLTSFDSSLSERDEVVREKMFGLPLFKGARLEITEVTGMPERGLEVGEEAICDARGKLTIGAVAEELSAPLKVVRTSEDGFHLSSVEPLNFSLEKWKLTERAVEVVSALQLQSIDDNVRVSLSVDIDEDDWVDPATTEVEEAAVEESDEAHHKAKARQRRPGAQRPPMRGKAPPRQR